MRCQVSHSQTKLTANRVIIRDFGLDLCFLAGSRLVVFLTSALAFCVRGLACSVAFARSGVFGRFAPLVSGEPVGVVFLDLHVLLAVERLEEHLL